jgi:hypothetical protein
VPLNHNQDPITDARKKRALQRIEDIQDRSLARRGIRNSGRVNLSFKGDQADLSRVNECCFIEHGCGFVAWMHKQWDTYLDMTPRRKKPRVTEAHLRSLSSLDLFLARFLEVDRDWAELVLAMAKRMQPGEFLSTGDMCDACEYPMDSVFRSRSSLQGIGRVMRLMKPIWSRHKIKRGDKWIWAYKKPVGMFFPEGYRT